LGSFILFTPENQQLTFVILPNTKKNHPYFSAFFSGSLGAKSSS